MKVNTSKLDEQIKHSSKTSLHEVLQDITEIDFVSKIEEIMLEKGLSKTSIIKLTTLDRTYAYQIMNRTKVPSKDKVLQLCIAMSCDLKTTNQLLKLSHNSPLYSKIKRDSVIIFAIHNSYSVIQTNELLDDYNFEIL